MNREELHFFYKDHLLNQVLPFWKSAVDEQHGGIYTSFNAEGSKLLSRDKYTWSQGRFLWIWSRLAELCEKEIWPEQAAGYLDQAEKSYRFLAQNALMPNDHCRFLLEEDGTPKEMILGEGHDISFYADCFVIMGFAEYGRVAGNRDAFELAERLFINVEQRLQKGIVRSEPYQVPAGMLVHGYAMIMLNTAQALIKAAEFFELEAKVRHYRQYAMEKCQHILEVLRDSNDRIHEVLPANEAGAGAREGSQVGSSEKLLLRHLNPGHSAECLWFIMQEAQEQDNTSMIAACVETLKAVLTSGWDEQYGGLFRYIDLDGGQPKGEPLEGASAFESLIRDTWDMKLWWPHSEALYACRLAFELTEDADIEKWYWKLHDYTFRLFPADAGMEWIQIRTREGAPANRVVALPVKDPYHIIRNMLMIIELTA